MVSDIYWIEHPRGSPRLAIMARPRAGDWLEDEINAWRQAGITTVVSLLEPAEISELGLEAEPGLCQANDIEFVSFSIPDRGVPDDAEALLRLCRSLNADRKAVAIHCRAGIGRSALVAASLLTMVGMDTEAAFAAISKARGLSVPDTETQNDWVRALASRTSAP